MKRILFFSCIAVFALSFAGCKGETASNSPVVTTVTANSITSTSAVCGGNVATDGGATVNYKGIVYGTTPSPMVGTSNTTYNMFQTNWFTDTIKGLTKGTTYYYRAYASSGQVISYGQEYNFTTLNSKIPSDDEADPNPTITNPNTTISNPTQSKEEYEGETVVRMDMTGVWNPVKSDWMRLLGTSDPNENIWLQIDGKPKGFIVYNNADGGGEGKKSIKVDLVFLVDNSGSMSEEADSVAAGILGWAKKLESSGIDIKFGCVGYSVSGSVNGGINICSADSLSIFLNYSTGTGRTAHFADSKLQVAAQKIKTVSDECGAMALLFADANLAFRAGANRIYVNFTDEPNQPNHVTQYSTEYFKDQANWSAAQGTVHTVFSADTTFSETMGSREKPWRLSWYTGGTFMAVNSSFSGVDLNKLPITGALVNSYIIRFSNFAELFDGKQHFVEITVLSTDGTVRAYKSFYVIFG